MVRISARPSRRQAASARGRGLGPIGTLRAALHPELEAWLVVVPARISATRQTSRQMNA